MLPFFIVATVFAALRLAGWLGVRPLNDWGVSLRWALAVMFLVTASGHWGSRRDDLIAMVPPVFPRPDLLVTITGVLEIAGAIGLMISRTSRLAAAGLAILMIAMFPANVYAAQQSLAINGKPVTPLAQRTAVQIGLVAAAAAIAMRRRTTSATKPPLLPGEDRRTLDDALHRHDQRHTPTPSGNIGPASHRLLRAITSIGSCTSRLLISSWTQSHARKASKE